MGKLGAPVSVTLRAFYVASAGYSGARPNPAGHHAPAMHPDPTRLITFRDFLENRPSKSARSVIGLPAQTARISLAIQSIKAHRELRGVPWPD